MSLNEGNLRLIQECLNDILECCVCKDVIDDARMLPCIHSFCLKCLKEMLSRCTENVITCPICRSEFPVPEDGVGSLQKNFFLMRLKETMQIVDSSSAANSSCDICRKDSGTGVDAPKAEMYCSDCKEKLCSKCCISHIRNVSNRRHTLIAISDNPEHKIELKPGTSIFCDRPNHKQHPINLYCLKCREVLCAMCYIEKHSNHERKEITDASKMFRDQIQQSITKLSPDTDILLRKKDELENGKSAVLLETEQLEKAIIDTRDAIVKRANDDAKSLLFVLSVKAKEKQKDVEILMGDVVFKYSCLDSYLSYCNGLSLEGSDIDICQAAHWLETRANELQQSTTADHLSSDVRFQMQFKKTDLETFLAQDNVIGELNEVQVCDEVQNIEEGEDVIGLENMYTLKMKPQLSGTGQPQVQAAELKDTASEVQVCDEVQNIEEGEDVIGLENMYTLKMKPQLSGTGQPQVQAAELKDTASEVQVCDEVQNIEEGEDVIGLENMYTLKMKPQLSGTGQPQVQAAELKDTASEVQVCDEVQNIEEGEDVIGLENMYTLKMKPQLSGTGQPQVQAAELKDTASDTLKRQLIDTDQPHVQAVESKDTASGDNNSGSNIHNDNEDSANSDSEGSGFVSSTDEPIVSSLESSLERTDDGSALTRTESRRSGLFGWIFARSNSGGDISETESTNGEKSNRRSSESEDNHRNPLCIHTIKTKSAASETHPICGITILFQELYVVSDESSTIEVYDTTSFALLRELYIARLVDPGDIASCTNYIYISDWKSRGQPNEILKVNAAGSLMKKWATPDDYSWLSVTHESHIVLTLHEENTINEYKPCGSLIRSVKIPPRSGIHHLWHAIKLTNGDFMVSYGIKNCHRVCQVDFNGTVMNSFGESSGFQRLRSAVYLAEDLRGSILVVDQSRGRVVQLHSNLQFQKQLFTRRHNLFSPVRIHVDASRGRLFVADRKCLISIFNFC